MNQEKKNKSFEYILSEIQACKIKNICLLFIGLLQNQIFWITCKNLAIIIATLYFLCKF